ncbi:cytochrome P450 [Pseudonocardia parietis]|uniref:Cytochrome P450 n=1 Tax=Pseudonocardia parietis TaxID=570936 RepID=A0ABS4VUQ8_9PSEU|nr:cytochrome P450 [Pseudonocardia parietis]MBP2367663.1 cytochrome P450 [Pseudonocardia parietis]
MTELRDVDYFRDTDTALRPYPYIDELVRESTVWIEPTYGVAMVTGYDEALTVMRDTDTYSAAPMIAGPTPDYGIEFTGDDIDEQLAAVRHRLPFNDQIVTMDPPLHTMHRALIMGLITPKRLKENEDFIWQLTDRQLDVVLPRGGCEIVDDYAQPYALLVVADLLGVPEEDHAMLLAKAGVAGPGSLGDTTAPPPKEHRGLTHLYDYFTDRIAQRRREPKDDVLTRMAHATFPDGTLPEPLDGARIAANLFAAGQETTVRLLATAMQILGDDLELQQRLRADHSLVPKFIEEVLRSQGPIKGNMRLARRSTTLGGVDIKAGTQVFVMHGAAGRDPRQFENPERFDVDRPNVRRHVAFGHGVHTCPGAPLARSEVRVTLERLLDRTSEIRISDAHHGPADARRYDYMPSYMFRGLTELHLEFVTEG